MPKISELKNELRQLKDNYHTTFAYVYSKLQEFEETQTLNKNLIICIHPRSHDFDLYFSVFVQDNVKDSHLFFINENDEIESETSKDNDFQKTLDLKDAYFFLNSFLKTTGMIK